MEKINYIRNCPICQKTFVAKRVDKVCCSGNCSSSWTRSKKDGASYTKRAYRRKNKTGIVIEDIDTNLFNTVKSYIYEMKNKSYYADYIDLYRLVHIYDLVYPKLNQVPYMNDVEKSIEIMFMQLCVWYKNKRDLVK